MNQHSAITAPRSLLQPHDSIDVRRESLRLFELMMPHERCDFLKWMCNELGTIGVNENGQGIQMTITNDTATASEAYLDMWQLCSQFSIDPSDALQALEHRVRKLTKPGRIYVPEEWA